jgi:integrase
MHPHAVTTSPKPPLALPRRRRAGTRREPVDLLQRAVTPGTFRIYRAAVQAWVEWAVEHGEDPLDEDDLDDCLLEYTQHLYEEGGSKSAAKNAVCGLGLLLPRLRRMLPKARLAIRGWNNLEPGTSYPPLTWELACLLAVHLSLKSSLLARLAIGVVLAFDCFLRVSELVNLRREDIGFAGDARLGMTDPGDSSANVIVIIRKGKTGKNQWVELMDPQLIELLRGLVKATKPGQLLFPVTTTIFRREFKAGCAELGLSPLYVPHSLRHGGATRYRHLKKWSIETVMHRGRWASGKSARLYIQAGVAMAMATEVPRSLHLAGFEFSKSLVDLLALWAR